MSSSCNHCGGSGSIGSNRVADPSSHRPAGMGLVICPVCGGAGKLGFDIAGSRKAGEKLGEGCALYMVNIFPVVMSWLAINTAIFQLAVLVGLIDEAPQFSDVMNNTAIYPRGLVFVFLGVIIAVFVFNKVFRSRVGWLITISFIVWFFAVPPSDAMTAAREKGLLHEQNTALDAAVLGLSGCRHGEESTRRADKTGMWANRVFCADESKALDDLLRSVLPEVISRYCSTRQQRADNRAGFDAAMWREPQAIVDRCSK